MSLISNYSPRQIHSHKREEPNSTVIARDTRQEWRKIHIFLINFIDTSEVLLADDNNTYVLAGLCCARDRRKSFKSIA